MKIHFNFPKIKFSLCSIFFYCWVFLVPIFWVLLIMFVVKFCFLIHFSHTREKMKSKCKHEVYQFSEYPWSHDLRRINGKKSIVTACYFWVFNFGHYLMQLAMCMYFSIIVKISTIFKWPILGNITKFCYFRNTIMISNHEVFLFQLSKLELCYLNNQKLFKGLQDWN